MERRKSESARGRGRYEQISGHGFSGQPDAARSPTLDRPANHETLHREKTGIAGVHERATVAEQGTEPLAHGCGEVGRRNQRRPLGHEMGVEIERPH